MIARYNETVRSLERRLDRLLQWSVCLLLLHTTGLPLKHAFLTPNGKAKGSNSVLDSIKKQLDGDASGWSVAKFQNQKPYFSVLAQEMFHNFSSDQNYAYKISTRVLLKIIKMLPI